MYEHDITLSSNLSSKGKYLMDPVIALAVITILISTTINCFYVRIKP